MSPRINLVGERARRWQAITSGAVILIGCVVLLGWLFNLTALKSILPGLATMKANTALGFVLVGGGLWTLHTQSGRRIAQMLALAVLLIGLLTLAEYLFSWNPGFDQWLFHDAATSAASFPGRMSGATALNFALLGLALWLASREAYFALMQFCALLALGIALFALAGYLYSISALYSFFPFASVALHTALTFVLAAVSVLLLQPRRGFVAAISADTPGGFMARRLLPAVIVVPLALGWLGLQGEEFGFFGDDLGLSLTILSVIVLFAPLIWLNARLLNRADAERKRGLDQIRRLHRTLAVLSAINQAIVRVRHLPTLYEKVCRIAIEMGEFRLIWIGLIDPATGTVTLAAHGGIADAELASLMRVVGDQARMEALVAGLKAAADPIVFNDAQGDQRVGLDARQAAKTLGYRSMVLLPLRVSGDLRGIITLCAEEANFFTDDELRLLDEMADDIAFALEFAEQEAQHQQARTALLESERRYHRALDSLLEGAQIIGYDWRYLYVNEAAAGHGQQGREALLGKTMMEEYPGIETTEMFAALRTCMNTRMAQHFENEFVYPDGASAWFDLSVQPIPEGIFILSLDISERKAAESGLKRYAERMEILHEIDSGIIEGGSIQAVVEATLKHLRRLIPCQRANLAIMDAATNEGLILALDMEGDSAIGQGARISIPADFREQYDARHMRVIDDMRPLRETKASLGQLVSEGMVSGLYVLLMDQERPIGSLGLFADSADFFTPEYQEIAAEIANQLAIAVQKLHLTDEIARHTAELERNVVEIRQAEAALREANETLEQRVAERTRELRGQERELRYYASLQESVTEAVISTDLDFRIQSWNRAAERIYGWSAAEVIGQSAADILQTEYGSDESEDRVLRDFMENGSWTAEVTQRHKEGRRLDILSSTVLFKDENGQPFGIVAVNHDIHERKQAEEALRDSEGRYRLLADNVNDMISQIDTAGNYVYLSPSSRLVIGYAPEELVGTSGFALVHPDDLGTVIGEQQAALNPNAHVSPVTYRIRHKDGHYLWVETNGKIIWSDDNSEIVGFITISRDLSERKRAEEALALSEQRFSLLVNSVSDYAIYVLDTEGHVVSWNPGAERIKGYRADEIVGQHFSRFYTPEDIEAGQPEAILRAAEQEGHYVGEGWRVRKDGSRFWAEVVVTALRDGEARLIGFTKISRDLTERKLAEESLQQALAKEHELGELKSRFVSMASHEFRTPLATILAAAETLSAYRARMTDAQIDHRIDNIRDQVTHLKNIIEDVLQLARIQAGRLEFNRVRFDLDSLCRSVIDEFESRPDITHELDYHCDDSLRQVTLDKRLMRQIINNLVSNAIKYSPDAKTVYIRLEFTNGSLVLSVRDQGIGIPEADMKHLFEPFHRASNVGTISGTGLGLSITKEAVELHGGTIRVESEVGVGTTFVITMPVSAKSENDDDKNTDH